MADLPNLIYTAAVSRPQQPRGVAEPQAPRTRLPRQAGSAGRLAPLLAILALSLLPLGMSAFVGRLPATHEPRRDLVYSKAPLRPALSTYRSSVYRLEGGAARPIGGVR